MLTTISLSKWMCSKWAFARSDDQDIVSRESTWSKQAEVAYNDACDVDQIRQKKKCPNEFYLENATTIAFLLLEILRTKKRTPGNTIQIDNVTVTLEVIQSPSVKKAPENSGDHLNALCKIKSVNLAFLHNQEQQPSFFQSLAVVLLKLYTRQESVPDWEAIRCGGELLFGGEEGGNNGAEFESDMLRALSILDNERESQFASRQKQRRHPLDSNTFSSIRNQYTTLPTSICRLLSDLIDAPSRTKTSFTSLNDVLNDLEQMVMKPDIFLHDSMLNDAKLDFGTKLYGRSEEVSQLLDIANDISSRRATGPFEIVSIGGCSGSGKSYLVRQVGQYLSSEGWIFIQGKFDRMRKSDAFSAVISPFESFCEMLQAMKSRGIQNDLDYCSHVSTIVLEALGHTGIDHLNRIMPSLHKIVDLESKFSNDIKDDTSGESDQGLIQTGDEALMSQRRCEYLMCAFVEAISGVGRPLLLFYDDIQWADASTLEFLRKLLKHLADHNKPRKNIMFVEAFRDNEANESDPIHRMISSIESYDSVNITKIKLGGFSKRSLNVILSFVLRLPRRITCPLSEVIHQKTMGNIFFVIEFMKTLESPENNILTYSLAKRRWVWDTDSVAIMSISDSVADLLVKKMLCIDKTVLKSLIIASCFGSQVNISVMELLNGMEGITNIVQKLDAAVDEGLLEKAGPLLMFAHDSIQQSVYELTPKNELIQLHVDIGLMLISKSGHASREMMEEIFASAVTHVNMSLLKCPDSDAAVEFTLSQHIVFAKLNLKAGKKAANGKSDFSLAQVHLKAGISFLSENSWEDQYDLTLQLFDEYANVLYVQHNFDELNTHVDIILENAKCIGDKIKAHELIISAMTMKGYIQEALDHAKSVLESLGFPFPPSVNSETVSGVMNSLSSISMAYTPDQLRTFPLMTDKVPLQAMKIMSAVHMHYSFSSPTLFQMLACQMVQLTHKHGLCVESAEAFANFGYCLNTVFRNYEAGNRMGKLSLVILDRFKAANRVAKVYFLVYGFLSVWKEPLQATIEGLRHGANTGLLEGDYNNAFFNKMTMCRQMLLAGYKLSELRSLLVRLCLDMMYDKSKKTTFAGFNSTLGDLYSVMSLTGEAEDEVFSIFGISHEENEKKLLEQYSATNNAPFIQIVYYHRLLKSFWFRNYEVALECCQKYVSFAQARKLRRVTDIVTGFFWGLSSLILSRRKKQRELVAKGEEIILSMQYWAKEGSTWNAENKAQLLEAEYHFAKGDSVKAKIAYEKSIQSAHEHKFIHEEALAYELFGIFCIEDGDLCKGNELVENARELYEQWGAKEKATLMFPL